VRGAFLVAISSLCACAGSNARDAGVNVDAGPSPLDDECVDENDCPQFARCVRGVCDTREDECNSDADCGRHYKCIDQLCDPDICDKGKLPCCADVDCKVSEQCVDFECTPIPCDVDGQCPDVIYGVTDITGCSNAGDCPRGCVCMELDESRCVVTISDDQCAAAGGGLEPVFAPDGSVGGVCTESLQCVDGNCVPF